MVLKDSPTFFELLFDAVKSFSAFAVVVSVVVSEAVVVVDEATVVMTEVVDEIVVVLVASVVVGTVVDTDTVSGDAVPLTGDSDLGDVCVEATNECVGKLPVDEVVGD